MVDINLTRNTNAVIVASNLVKEALASFTEQDSLRR